MSRKGMSAKVKARWGMLRKFIVKSKSQQEQPGSKHSVRAHPGYGFVTKSTRDDAFEEYRCKECDWKVTNEPKLPWECAEYRVDGTVVLSRIRKPGAASLRDHVVSQECGVDNTGNVCLWPCERLLSWLMVRAWNDSGGLSPFSVLKDGKLQFHVPKGGCVCELGAGAAGLAGMALSKVASTSALRMFLTDGNPQCVTTLKDNIHLNGWCKSFVSAHLLKWEREPSDVTSSVESLIGPCDLVFGADCLFFEQYHVDLVSTLSRTMSYPNGQCLMLAPSRGGSLARFVRTLLQHKVHGEGEDSEQKTTRQFEVRCFGRNVEKLFDDKISGNDRITLEAKGYCDDVERLTDKFLQSNTISKQKLQSNDKQEERKGTPKLSECGLYDMNLHYPLLLVIGWYHKD